jgi:hypothetical protein
MPALKRLLIRISVTDAHGPVARSRAIRLTECDLAWLVEEAERLERAS